MTHNGPEVLFKTCVAIKFVDDDDDDDVVVHDWYLSNLVSIQQLSLEH